MKFFRRSFLNAVSLGGDSDTLACISGGIAQAYYGGISSYIIEQVIARLPEELWQITDQFCQKYGIEI